MHLIQDNDASLPQRGGGGQKRFRKKKLINRAICRIAGYGIIDKSVRVQPSQRETRMSKKIEKEEGKARGPEDPGEGRFEVSRRSSEQQKFASRPATGAMEIRRRFLCGNRRKSRRRKGLFDPVSQ